METVTASGSTTIRVDWDGSGVGFAFADVAVLQGVSTDLAGLLANGSILGVGNTAVAAIQGTAGDDNKAGTASSDVILGLAGNDSLTGLAGGDTLDGGTGADTMAGGTGNDTYVVDSVGDWIVEGAGDANDRMLASISVDLNVRYANIEHVTLTGTAALNATGNGADNMLTGNGGANILDGGVGDDTLIGGAGNDTYKVDSGTDVVTELPGGGIDTVANSAFTFTLGPNIENLTMTGNNAANGIGNELSNKITGTGAGTILFDFQALFGNGGNDTLIGNTHSDHLNGGTGADSMVGGAGSDIYFVDDAGDKVMESGPSTDIDSVESSITYTLGATLEDLTLLGNANIDGTGNSLNNDIGVTGGSGDNVLSGLGGNDTMFAGTGNDLLLGGDGSDFLFLDSGLDTAVGGAGSDTFEPISLNGLDVIADFSVGPGGDLLDLESILNGFDFATDNINDFLRTSTANGSTTIQFDGDGNANGVAFVDLVALQGVSTDLVGLLTSGNLILG